MGAAGPTWWFVGEAKAAREPGAVEPEWLSDADVHEDDAPVDDEEPPTVPRELFVPFAPRPRRRLLLVATLFVGAVALLFVLDRSRESTRASPSAPAPVRTVLPRATRILAPASEPSAQPQPATSAPMLVAVPSPPPAPTASPAASESRAASEYVPTEL